MTRTPTISKNPGAARIHGTEGWLAPGGVGSSSRSKLLLPPCRGGTVLATLTAMTPGRASIRSSARSQKAARLVPSPYDPADRETLIVIRLSGSNPGSTALR